MKKPPFIVTGVLVATSILSMVQAQATVPTSGDASPASSGKGEARFGEADSNHDGKLSLAEWLASRNRQAAEHFRKIDTNQDGVLTQDEMRQAHQQHHGANGGQGGKGGRLQGNWQSLDIDGDHALSRSELGDEMPRLAAHFDEIDVDHNGKISLEELKSGREALKK